MAKRILIRRDTAQHWYDNNPMLYPGEIGIETDTLKIKIGPPVISPAVGTAWRSITSYINVVPSDLNSTLGDYLLVSDLNDTVAALDGNQNLLVPSDSIIFEGATLDSYQLSLVATDPTADRTITLPDASGTLALTTDIPSMTTDNVTEGTNKYFTDERAQDAVAAALAAGTHTNITVSYDDSGNSISLTGAQTYNDEMARDAIGAALTAGTGVTITSNDGADTITVAVDSTIATKSYADTAASTAVSNLIASAPSTLDTLNELAAALGNDANFSTTVTNALANKQDKVTGVSDTEIGYLDGVTSAIQTQINDKISATSTDTLTNKSISLTTNTLTGTTAEFNTALSDDNFVTISGIETLANKTLTTPTISSFSNANHTHTDSNSGGTLSSSAISDFTEASQDAVNSALTAGTGISKSYDDNGNTITISNTGVTSISGTSNQISASGSTGSITLSLPNSVTFPGTVTLNADPTQALHAVTKQYVDGIAAGLTWKAAVNLLADSNVSLTGNTGTLTIDGHSALTQSHGDGYRIFLKGQSTGSENGIYVYSDNGSTYSMARSSDADTYSELEGASVFVMEGTTYGKTSWIQTNHYLSSFSNQVWSQSSGQGTYVAGNGITLTGNSFAIDTSVTVDKNTSQTLTNKTITGSFTGNLTGNADTVTNGVYTTGTYSNPAWITSLGWSKISSTPTTVSGYGITDGVVTGGTYSDPSWITSLAWSKVSSTPTTLAGYGITDAQALDADLTAIAAISATSGLLKKTAANTWELDTNTYLTTSSAASTYLPLTGGTLSSDLIITGNLTVNGTTTNLNSTNLVIEDKNIILADVASPTNITADGGGITIKGSTDKTFNWVAATTAFTSSEDLDLASGKVLKINGTQVLSATEYTGNAATVTNGVYTSGSYSDPSWLTISKSKVGLGNVENTALSTWAGSSNITTLGTVATGTWSATTIATTKGGTGLTSYTTGDVLYASGTNTLAKLAAGTDGYLLTMSSGVPTWAAAPVTLPSQTGNSGKFLTTNGSSASWADTPITTGTATISANTATTIDTNALSGFTSVEYMVSLKQGSKIRTSKVILQTDGTSVDMTEFAITETGGTMTGVVVSATASAGNALLQVTVTDASSTNVTVKFSEIKF